ncbi:hypothetical protein PAMP_008537 [Pampus punctatissimus]
MERNHSVVMLVGKDVDNRHMSEVTSVLFRAAAGKSEDDGEKPHSFIKDKLRRTKRQSRQTAPQLHRWKQKLMEDQNFELGHGTWSEG